MDFLNSTAKETNIKRETKRQDFEQLLNNYEYQVPSSGDLMTGEVVIAEEDTVIIDLGIKRDGIVPANEIRQLSEEQRQDLQVGTLVVVYVIKPYNQRGDLLVSILKGLEHDDWEKAKTYLEDGEVIQVKPVFQGRSGMRVRFGILDGFIPRSHQSRRAKSKQDGSTEETLQVKVLEADPANNRLVFSEKEANKDLRKQRVQAFEQGQILDGQVTALVDFGAFVDIGGVEGLLHKSEISWSWVSDPSEFLDEGEEIQVLIKSIDEERGRISLSRKRLLPNPKQREKREAEVPSI